MSGAFTWLHNQRKTELVELAEKVGLQNYDSLKKADLETALDDFLRTNSTKFSKDSNLSPYYKRIAASPSKEVAVAEKDSKAAAKPRRKTITKSEVEETSGSSSALVKTPKDKADKSAKLQFPANVPLPPSPAVIAEQVDRQIQRQSSKLRKVYKQSGIGEITDDFRDRVSTTASIETAALIVEFLGLRSELLPLKFLTTLPASKTLGTGEIPVKVFDLFNILTANFWSVLLLWFATSVAIPMTAAYFFNPTLKAKHGHVKNAKSSQGVVQYDPLTFNIAKALTVFLVYGSGVTLFGVPGSLLKSQVNDSIPGGYYGILIASGIGALTSLYEAVLRK